MIVHHNLKIQSKYTYEECFNEKLDECIYEVNGSTHGRAGGAHMSQVNIKTNIISNQIKFQRYYLVYLLGTINKNLEFLQQKFWSFAF